MSRTKKEILFVTLVYNTRSSWQYEEYLRTTTDRILEVLRDEYDVSDYRIGGYRDRDRIKAEAAHGKYAVMLVYVPFVHLGGLVEEYTFFSAYYRQSAHCLRDIKQSVSEMKYLLYTCQDSFGVVAGVEGCLNEEMGRPNLTVTKSDPEDMDSDIKELKLCLNSLAKSAQRQLDFPTNR